jgi:membrane associated rhomboid family serine protease
LEAVSIAEAPSRGGHALRRGASPVALEAEGFHHPTSPRGRGHAFTRYADLTHVAATPRALWIGTRRSVYPLPRSLFVDPAGPQRLAQALLERVAREPGGAEQLARMRELDRMALSAPAPRATWILAAACLAVFALQVVHAADVFDVGYFSLPLFTDGDLWRAFTAGLLHGFPLHLAVNVAGLVLVGRLAERSLGTPRLLCVMGTSEVASMAASAAVDSGGVVGISGVVFGLAGALLFVELRRASELPATWRFPRLALVAVIAGILLDALLGFAIPLIAGEAHLGGFAAGFATAALTTRSAPLHAPAGPASRAAAAAVVAASLLSVGAAAAALISAGDYRAAHAARIARLPGISPSELNNHAWLIAIDGDSTRDQLEAALLLAKRAVEATERQDPTILDTLAEVLFQLGRAQLAVAVIDEAIHRAPGESYYREQRRRFTGERDPDDRPPDPALRWDRGRPPLPPDSEGIRV